MTRIVAIISFCLAVLLSIPVYGQCPEVSESEMDPEEVECCVMSCQERQTVSVRNVIKSHIVRETEKYRFPTVESRYIFKPMTRYGILYCILRE